MKICKCGHELDDHNGPYGDRECTALNCGCEQFVGRASEPSPTEGTPFTEPLEKGWLGTVLKEVRQTADSFEVPAPVAQVDAGKCIYCGLYLVERNGEWVAKEGGIITVICSSTTGRHHKPAVAQTELPPARYTDAEFEQAKSELSDKGARYERALRYARERELREYITRVTSLTQRLQEQEANRCCAKCVWLETELEAIKRLTVEPLQVSHKALLDSVEDILGYTGGADSALEDEYVMERLHANWAVAQKLAAEKL